VKNPDLDPVEKGGYAVETRCFGFTLLKGRDPDLPLWIGLAVYRCLKRWAGGTS
jgi:hypothetical protein